MKRIPAGLRRRVRFLHLPVRRGRRQVKIAGPPHGSPGDRERARGPSRGHLQRSNSVKSPGGSACALYLDIAFPIQAAVVVVGGGVRTHRRAPPALSLDSRAPIKTLRFILYVYRIKVRKPQKRSGNGEIFI